MTGDYVPGDYVSSIKAGVEGLRDATPGELADEPDEIVKMLAAGDLGATARTVELARAELGQRARALIERGGSLVEGARCSGRWFTSEPEVECPSPAMVCSECVRAIALKWWGGVARHAHMGEATTTCMLCELGAAAYCPTHFLACVRAQREMLRAGGNQIGEPEWRL